MSHEVILILSLGLVGLFGIAVAVVVFINAKKKQQTQPPGFNRRRNAIVIAILVGIPIMVLNNFEKKTTWQEFSFKEGNFVVQMPGSPVETKKMMTGADFSAELHTFLLDQKSGAYAISYYDIPADVPLKPIEEVLDVNRNGMINGVKGKLLNETSILLNGYPGREVTVQVPNVPDMIGRLYFVDRRIYTLIAATSKLEDGKKFLDSFKLLDKQEKK